MKIRIFPNSCDSTNPSSSLHTVTTRRRGKVLGTLAAIGLAIGMAGGFAEPAYAQRAIDPCQKANRARASYARAIATHQRVALDLLDSELRPDGMYNIDYINEYGQRIQGQWSEQTLTVEISYQTQMMDVNEEWAAEELWKAAEMGC